MSSGIIASIFFGVSFAFAVYCVREFSKPMRYVDVFGYSMLPLAMTLAFVVVEKVVSIPDPLNIALLFGSFLAAPIYILSLHGHTDFHERQAIYSGLIYGTAVLGYATGLLTYAMTNFGGTLL